MITMVSMKIFVKPASGKRVLDPKTKKELPEMGMEVPKNSYWLRRLRDGDVESPPVRGSKELKAKSEAPKKDADKPKEKKGE